MTARRTVLFVPAHNTRRNKNSLEADFWNIVHIFFSFEIQTYDTRYMYLEDSLNVLVGTFLLVSNEVFLLRLDFFLFLLSGFVPKFKKIENGKARTQSCDSFP